MFDSVSCYGPASLIPTVVELDENISSCMITEVIEVKCA